jgi:hypothetical protein
MHICADADVDAGSRSHFIHPPAIQCRQLHNRASPSIHFLANESTRKAFRLSLPIIPTIFYFLQDDLGSLQRICHYVASPSQPLSHLFLIRRVNTDVFNDFNPHAMPDRLCSAVYGPQKVGK